MSFYRLYKRKATVQMISPDGLFGGRHVCPKSMPFCRLAKKAMWPRIVLRAAVWPMPSLVLDLLGVQF
jgi:hypothetical protein